MGSLRPVAFAFRQVKCNSLFRLFGRIVHSDWLAGLIGRSVGTGPLAGTGRPAGWRG
jgi:hypothetical protein